MTNSTTEQPNRLNQLEASLNQLQERQFALEQVVGWLLAQHPDEAFRYLTASANLLEDQPQNEAFVALLDELANEVHHWRQRRQIDQNK